MLEGPMSRTETKGEKKGTTTTKQNTSNSSNLVEEVTPHYSFLGTKPFVIFTDAIFKNWFNRFFFSLC